MAADPGRPRPPPAPPGAAPAPPRRVLLLGPALHALSGVSSHLRVLQASPLGRRFELLHFQVGSEGRVETRVGRLVRLIAAPWSLARQIRAAGVALVHINTSLNRLAFWRDLLHLAVARACGARVLLQVHGGALPQDFFRHSRLLTALLRCTLRSADAVVVLARCELNAYSSFVPAQRVLLIPNAVAGTAEPPARQPRPDALRLVYVGRLAREKGLFELLLGLRQANLEGAAAHQLTLAGDGPDAAALRRQVQALGLAAQVAFAGAVGDTQRARLLAAADVFVLPSHAEGLPYALLEAMAAGLPVIATPVGAIPDLVEHGVHGLLVAPGDVRGLARAIGRLAARHQCLAAMGWAGRARVAQRCSVRGLVGCFTRLYEQLLVPRGR